MKCDFCSKEFEKNEKGGWHIGIYDARIEKKYHYRCATKAGVPAFKFK